MISLVTATYGRVDEFRVLLDSLSKQTYKNFELIVVDQNSHTLLEEMVQHYSILFTIVYLRSPIKGLSYNRNIGLRHCRGEIVGFPDDDCFYDEDVLKWVAETLNVDTKYTFVASEVKDVSSKEIFIHKKIGTIKRCDVFKYCISYNFFIRNINIQFDVRLGIGSYWGSGEETDYLWENLKKKDIGLFLPNVFIYHPQNGSSTNYHRAYSYGLGFGALFKKEIIGRRHVSYMFLYLYNVGRTALGLMLKRNRLFYYYTLLGRIKGFFSYHITI